MVINDSLWIVATDKQMSDLGCIVDSLQFQLNNVQEKNDMLLYIIGQSNESIATQFSLLNIILTVIAILVAVGGGFVSFYIRKKKNEVETMLKKVEEKKQTVDEIAATTKELDNQIKNNIKDLYKKLRKEETNTFLDRLIVEPHDISNLGDLLLARELDDDGFNKIKEAYLKLVEEPQDTFDDNQGIINFSPSHDECYLILFFQHFCYLSVKDDLIRPNLVNILPKIIKCAFKRDIINSTIELCKALKEETSTFNKEDVLTAYLKALNNSQYKNLEELKNIFEQNINPQALLQQAIERCTNEGVYLSLFGISEPKKEANNHSE